MERTSGTCSYMASIPMLRGCLTCMPRSSRPAMGPEILAKPAGSSLYEVLPERRLSTCDCASDGCCSWRGVVCCELKKGLLGLGAAEPLCPLLSLGDGSTDCCIMASAVCRAGGRKRVGGCPAVLLRVLPPALLAISAAFSRWYRDLQWASQAGLFLADHGGT